MKNKKNNYYCHNNSYPIKKQCCKNNSILNPLFEVESFLCKIKQVSQYVKLMKFFK